MPELKGKKLYFKFHEAAWSRRTTGFPIWGFDSDGKIVEIGETKKRSFSIQLSDKPVAVRYYESNRGYITLFVYYVDNGKLKEVIVEEQRDWEIPEMPENVKKLVQRIVDKLKNDVYYMEIAEK